MQKLLVPAAFLLAALAAPAHAQVEQSVFLSNATAASVDLTIRVRNTQTKNARADSTGQSNSLCKNSRGCAKAEGFARACVQLHRNMVQIALGVDG